MSYAYGMKGPPAIGGGLPGLPQRSAGNSGAVVSRVTYTRIVTPGSGVIDPPEGAKFMRVAIVGGGGGVFNSTPTTTPVCGGGGCAASKPVPAAAIAYTVGSGGYESGGIKSSATFLNYAMEATGGGATGGIGIGGDYNFKGGDGGTGFHGGAGAAGPNGNGGAPSAPGQFAGTGWGPGGGGGGGTVSGGVEAAAGGGGAGAPGGNYGGGAGNRNPASGKYFGETPYLDAAYRGGDGGVMGGGAGRYSGTTAVGGVGGVLVEWFYAD